MYLISIVYESLVYRVSFYNEHLASFKSISIDIDTRYLKFTVV